MVSPLKTATNSIGLKLALIPAGEFFRGSPDSDEMAFDKEKPQHVVEITKPFYLGVYPVTQAGYEKVMGDNPSQCKGDDRRPVEMVSWFDALAFCNSLSGIEELQPYYEINGDEVSIVGGAGYRLPTEAKWEYACRAGTTTKWSFGDDESQLGEFAWFRNLRSLLAASDWHDMVTISHPVGEKKANTWGLHDMHGNVLEWCWDWYGYYNNLPMSDPQGPASGNCRVFRGGGWASFFPKSLRSANRNIGSPMSRNFCVGFRLARTMPQEE